MEDKNRELNPEELAQGVGGMNDDEVVVKITSPEQNAREQRLARQAKREKKAGEGMEEFIRRRRLTSVDAKYVREHWDQL